MPKVLCCRGYNLLARCLAFARNIDSVGLDWNGEGIMQQQLQLTGHVPSFRPHHARIALVRNHHLVPIRTSLRANPFPHIPSDRHIRFLPFMLRLFSSRCDFETIPLTHRAYKYPADRSTSSPSYSGVKNNVRVRGLSGWLSSASNSAAYKVFHSICFAGISIFSCSRSSWRLVLSQTCITVKQGMRQAVPRIANKGRSTYTQLSGCSSLML